MCSQWGLEQVELIRLGGMNFARVQAKLLQMEVNRRLADRDPSRQP
jgi:hypothetical protein